MHIKIKSSLLLLLFLFLQGCNVVDIQGLFFSSSISNRFRKSVILWPAQAPTVADENNYSFLVITDPHYTDTDLQLFKEIEDNRIKWGIEFVVIAGDITQTGEQLQYDLMILDRNRFDGDVRCIPGNHDIYNGNADNYFKNLGPGNYSFTIGNSLFIMLDTANGTLGERQWDWYDDILKKTSSDNIFVLSHYSLFDEGTQSAGSWPSNEEKYALIALNTKYKVDYFFSGHLHRYRETLIDDVRYIMLNDLKDGDFNTMLKVTVSESELDCTFVK